MQPKKRTSKLSEQTGTLCRRPSPDRTEVGSETKLSAFEKNKKLMQWLVKFQCIPEPISREELAFFISQCCITSHRDNRIQL